MWKRIKLSSTEEVKARRKLELAEYALRACDYDSVVGDAYRCVELCIIPRDFPKILDWVKNLEYVMYLGFMEINKPEYLKIY